MQVSEADLKRSIFEGLPAEQSTVATVHKSWNVLMREPIINFMENLLDTDKANKWSELGQKSIGMFPCANVEVSLCH